MTSAAVKSAVGNDVVSLGRRNVELLITLQNPPNLGEKSRALQEYVQNCEVIDRLLSGPTTSQTSRFTVTPSATNGHVKQTARKVVTPSVDGSKTDFVEACFLNNPGTNPKDINDLWVQGGGDGTISPSLVYKTKHDMRKTKASAKKVAAAPRKPPSVSTAVAEPVSDVREAIWVLLRQRPMNIGEIILAIREGELIDHIPRKLEEIVKATLDEYRTNGQIERVENRRYQISAGN